MVSQPARVDHELPDRDWGLLVLLVSSNSGILIPRVVVSQHHIRQACFRLPRNLKRFMAERI